MCIRDRVISKNEFICKQFKSLTRFPLTEKETKDVDDNVKPRECINCELGYTNAKNSIDSCSYHDGPLVDIRADREGMIHLDKQSLYSNFVQSDAKDRQDMLKNFVYLCCFQAYNTGGCKKDFHSDKENKKDYVKYKNYF